LAWSAGIHWLECDVAITKDEKLMLAHDEDFQRLALDPSNVCSKKKVGDLTMKEIISLTFKSGTRPPLLLDVLQSAAAIGGPARLVIEVKPGNQEACTALIRLFRKHPELIERVAVVMSFDAYTMHRLKFGLNELVSLLEAASSSSANNSCWDPIARRSDSPDNARSSRMTATAPPILFRSCLRSSSSRWPASPRSTTTCRCRSPTTRPFITGSCMRTSLLWMGCT